MKLIWMSDPHFAAKGDVLGHDPRLRLDAAIQHVNTHHADAAFSVISGDLVNRGTAQDYATLAEQLSGLATPYLPMVGNHDNRTLFRQHLPVPADGMGEHVQYAVQTEAALLLCLDTLKAGSDAGEFCDARMAWLEDRLANADRPVILFMHHPPMPLGLPTQDTENLQDGKKLLDLVSRFDAVMQLCIGHVHRPICGNVRGSPFATMPSLLFQAPAPEPAWDWTNFAPAKEPPQIGVMRLNATDVTIQFQQYCRYDLGVNG